MEIDKRLRTLTALCTLACAAAWPAGAEEMLRLDGDAFTNKPPAADAAGKPACAPARKYVELINAARYGELASLFAGDAVFMPPTGQVVRGADKIGAFYAEFLGRGTRNIVPISFLAVGNECLMELASKSTMTGHPDQYVLAAIDHLTVGADGRIVQMVVYVRPRLAALDGSAHTADSPSAAPPGKP